MHTYTMKSSAELFPLYPKCGVVVLNWNGAEDTIDCLESLKNVTYPDLLVVIIDNASTDGSFAQIQEWVQENGITLKLLIYPGSLLESKTPPSLPGKEIVLIRSQENLGFCKGNNLGMEQAVKLGADYILILNNDTLVSPNFLEPMVALAESDEKIGLVGGVITYCDEPDTIWWAGGTFNRFLAGKRVLDRQPLSELKHDQPFATDWVSGCMMMIPTTIYRKLGGFDEDYFIWSEEWDLSLRVAHAGYKLMVAPGSRICHKVGHSLGVMKPLNYYYGIRNGLYFKYKYLPKHLWYPYLVQYMFNRLVRYTQLLLQGRKDLVFAGLAALADFFGGRAGKWRYQE